MSINNKLLFVTSEKGFLSYTPEYGSNIKEYSGPIKGSVSSFFAIIQGMINTIYNGSLLCVAPLDIEKNIFLKGAWLIKIDLEINKWLLLVFFNDKKIVLELDKKILEALYKTSKNSCREFWRGS